MNNLPMYNQHLTDFITEENERLIRDVKPGVEYHWFDLTDKQKEHLESNGIEVRFTESGSGEKFSIVKKITK